MTLVRNDDVEGVDRDGRIVGNWLWSTLEHFERCPGKLIQLWLQFFALQHREQPLDRRDADLGYRVDPVRLHVLNVVQLREYPPVVGGAERLKLLQRLPTKVATIHEEQNPSVSGELDEAIQKVAGRISFAGTGRHLDESPPSSLAQRVLQGSDCRDLRRSKSILNQRWHRSQSCLRSRRSRLNLIRQPV